MAGTDDWQGAPPPLDQRPLGKVFPRVDTSEPTEAWDAATGQVTPLPQARVATPTLTGHERGGE